MPKYPLKRNQHTFTLPDGKEPKASPLNFRAPISIDAAIRSSANAAGVSLGDWLLAAAIAKLNQEKSPAEAEQLGLKQGQLDGTVGSDATTEPPPAETGETPTSGDPSLAENPATEAKPRSQRQTSPRARIGTTKTPRRGRAGK